MAYSTELHDRAREEINKRRKKAEDEAARRRAEIITQYDDIGEIEAVLSSTGLAIASAMGLSGENLTAKIEQIRQNNKELIGKRNQLFKKYNIPENYFDIQYTCPKCNDSGMIENYDAEKNVSYGANFCDCYLDILKGYAIAKMTKSTPLELSNFEDFNLDYYPDAMINGESPYREMAKVFNSCKKYAENFDTDSASLYFFGRTGLGKTHLSLAIANEAIKKGYNVIYGSVINFLNKMEKEKFGRVESSIDTEELLIDADLLILDDLGAEFSTAYTVSALYNIINSRIARGVPTIISSNLDLEELKSRYPESVASRIIGNYATVQFIGKDIRQIQSAE